MRKEEFCMSIVSLVLNLEEVLKSEAVKDEVKRGLSEDFKRLIGKVGDAQRQIKKEGGSRNGLHAGA